MTLSEVRRESVGEEKEALKVAQFLSDPGKPGVRSLGPDVTNKLLDVCKT